MTYQIMPDALPPLVSERRRPTRHKTFLGGLAVSRGATRTVDCTIKNLSVGGAKVQVRGSQVIPEHAYLVIAGQGFAFEALVVWARRNEFGLKFIASHALDALDGLKLTYMKRFLQDKFPPALGD